MQWKEQFAHPKQTTTRQRAIEMSVDVALDISYYNIIKNRLLSVVQTYIWGTHHCRNSGYISSASFKTCKNHPTNHLLLTEVSSHVCAEQKSRCNWPTVRSRLCRNVPPPPLSCITTAFNRSIRIDSIPKKGATSIFSIQKGRTVDFRHTKNMFLQYQAHHKGAFSIVPLLNHIK